MVLGKRGRVKFKGLLLMLSIVAFVSIYLNHKSKDFITGFAQTNLTKSDSSLWLIILLAVFLLVVLTLIFTYLHFSSTKNKLRRKLKKISLSEPIGSLKYQYQEIYNLYLKLSESNKRNFYSKVIGFREEIENKLKAEKKIEDLSQSTGTSSAGDFDQQRKNYQEMVKLSSKLSPDVLEEYNPQLAHLKEQLEQGKNSF